MTTAPTHRSTATPQTSPAGPIAPYRHEKALFIILAVLAILFWTILTVITLGTIWLLVGLAYIFRLFAFSTFISRLEGTAVRVDVDQFPELHARLLLCAARVGLKKPPDAYLMAGRGGLDSFATRFLRRDHVVLPSDVVDALKDDPDAIHFYIGRELGHLARKHIAHDWWLGPMEHLPLLGSAYHRAQVYTCDQYGLACCPSPAVAIHALAVPAAGSTLWKDMSPAAYMRQCQDTGGFWMSINELCGDEPWLCKRLYHINPEPAPALPRRHFLAWTLAPLIPRLGLGGPFGGLALLLTVLGLGAAYGIPAYQTAQLRAEVEPVFEYASKATATLGNYYRTHQTLPANLADIGIKPEASGLPIEKLFIGDGNELHLELVNGKQMLFDPSIDEHADVVWDCSTDLPSVAIPAGFHCESAQTNAPAPGLLTQVTERLLQWAKLFN